MIEMRQKRLFKNIILFMLPVLFAISCEEPFIPNGDIYKEQIVVEGYIETGRDALPAYVILTRTLPFLANIDGQDFNNLFIKNADVSVFDGNKTVQFTELCLQDLPEEIRRKAAETLGLNADSLKANICIYVDILDQLNRREGGKYDLTVKAENQILTATTTLPNAVDLTDFKWVEPVGKPIDTMAELRVKIKDPVNERNYYRYLTATDQDRQFLPPPFGSVVDDALFNGQEFEIPLPRSQRRNRKDFNPDTFGLYMRGDSAFIKWCAIDKAHFDFWNTRDYAAGNSGTFSTYTRVTSNIKGGLGIWGGYTVRLYKLYCPPK